MSIGHLVSVIFPVLTVIVSGACVLLFGVTTTLRQTAGDLRSRVEDLEKERREDKTTIEKQAAELIVWQKAVTGEAYLVALTDLLTDHDRRSVEAWKRLEDVVAQHHATVLGELRALILREAE